MKNKKILTALIATSLVAVVAIGGTLAYFSSVTQTATNTFTMGAGISGDVEEPLWDDEGKEDAENFYPGQVISKDPRIVNTSAMIDNEPQSAYVAAVISYQVADGNGGWTDTTYDELDKFINILSAERDSQGAVVEDNDGNVVYTNAFNTTYWNMNSDNTLAYYKSTLTGITSTNANGTSSETIFDKVEIDPLALTPDQILSVTDGNEATVAQFDVSKYTDADGVTYTEYQMNNFQITVTGYLVQTDGFDTAEAAMQAAFPDVFVTTVAPVEPTE